ncbi:MAG: hypothetical protein ACRD25_05380 [Terracidiphilus sp.]
MNGRRIIPVALLVLAGILSLSASLFGALSLVTAVRSAGTGLHLAFSIPLILLFPIFCVSLFLPRLSAVLQFVDAFSFLIATLIVNMHACGGNQPCPGILHIAIGSFLQGTTMVPFVIAALQTLSVYIRSPLPATPPVRRSI